VDRSIFLWIVEHRVSWLDWILVGVTAAGYGGALWIVLAPVLAPLGGVGRVRAALLTAAGVWTADLIALGIKTLTDRPRPPRHLVLPQAEPFLSFTVGSGMPSGHATTAFAGAVILAFLLRRAAPYLIALAGVMAFSRIYVGLHWPSDVVAGALLGTAVALAAIMIVRTGSAGRGRGRAG
jgi:undecaprenyl-diphosphatase